jgi:iron(III) transport system ATP-binding protein
MIFQEPMTALNPLRTIGDQIGEMFVIHTALSRKEIAARVEEALAMVRLDQLGGRIATKLSGGQQQRLALARALITRPDVLLLDEPLSNLDAKLREEMRFEIKALTNTLGIATIYVTHDQGEALSMSDRIAVMSDGKIMQLGTPREIYLTPSSGQVARIAGSVNLLHGAISEKSGQLGEVRTPSGQVLSCRVVSEKPVGGEVDVMFRPELVRVVRPNEVNGKNNGPDGPDNILPGKVQAVVFAGDHIACQCETSDGIVAAKLAPNSQIQNGEDVRVLISAGSCIAS